MAVDIDCRKACLYAFGEFQVSNKYRAVADRNLFRMAEGKQSNVAQRAAQSIFATGAQCLGCVIDYQTMWCRENATYLVHPTGIPVQVRHNCGFRPGGSSLCPFR